MHSNQFRRFVNIQNTIVVVVDVDCVGNTITIGVDRFHIIAIVQVRLRRCSVATICRSVVIAISQLECTSVVPQSTDVGEIISCFMSRAVIKTIESNSSIGPAIAIGIVVSKTAFDDVQDTIVVAVQIKPINILVSVGVGLVKSGNAYVSTVDALVGYIIRFAIGVGRDVVGGGLSFDVVRDAVVVTIEIQMIGDTIVVTVGPILGSCDRVGKATLTETKSESSRAIGIVEQFNFEPVRVQVIQLNVVIRVVDGTAEANKTIIFNLRRETTTIFQGVRV